MAHLKDFRGIENTNFFTLNSGLQTLLADLLKPDDRAEVFASLQECGELAGGRWNELARLGSQTEQLPKILKLDRVGNPIERIEFSPYTSQLRREVAEFGLLTQTKNELHKFAFIYLLAHNGEASLTCPISCTDGLVRVLEAKGTETLQATYLPHLRSTETPFAGAQFVTERTGGSDVGSIEMQARHNGDGSWLLTGEKWFCSNPDEFFAVAARPVGAQPGTTGLALFFVPRRLPDGRLNRISFRRLKNKLGTQSLPTAELAFEGATGYLIGEADEGFKTLMNYVLNASRIHNAVNACGILHRAFLEARNYTRQREAFGQPIGAFPLVQESLVTLLARSWRTRTLTFRLIALVDHYGLVPEAPEQALWQRFLVNLAKYRTAVILAESVKDAILHFGGNGIVEDFSILPRLLRDAMIIETWEGPHNTLCLQILRDGARSGLFDRWRSEVGHVLALWPSDFLSVTRQRYATAFEQVCTMLTRKDFAKPAWAERNARRFTDYLGGLLELGWMVEIAVKRHNTDATAAVLAAVACTELFPDENAFAHPLFDMVGEHAQALIDKTPFQLDVTNF